MNDDDWSINCCYKRSLIGWNPIKIIWKAICYLLSSLQDPRLLQCGHTFCFGCLQDLVNQGQNNPYNYGRRVIICPHCGKQHPLNRHQGVNGYVFSVGRNLLAGHEGHVLLILKMFSEELLNCWTIWGETDQVSWETPWFCETFLPDIFRLKCMAKKVFMKPEKSVFNLIQCS